MIGKGVRMKNTVGVSLWEKTALASILVLLSVVTVGLLGLAIGIGLGAYTFLIGAAICAIILFFRDRQMLWLFGAVVALLALWSIVCGFFFDWSYDGMYFHKQAVITLKEGWNPFYQSSLDASVFASYPDMDLWLDNYPNGSWIFSAVIYSITNRLETAKAVNLLFLLPVFALAVDVLRSVFGMGRKKSIAFGVLFVINPVFICQVFTFYNDLPVGAFMILTALLCIKIVSGRANAYSYVLLFGTIAFSCTVKFTAPVLCAAVLLPFGIYYAWKSRHEIKKFIRPVSVVLAGFVIGGFVLGFHPYVTHIMEGKHVIYPVMGEGSYDIMNTNPPKGFEGKSTPEKLLISLFSKTNNFIEEEPELKIPFSIYPSEWIHLSNADIRIGGFGVLFSGILCLSLLALVLTWIHTKKMRAEIAIILGVLLLLALFFPESWWARYSCFTYYIPVFCLIYAAGMEKQKGMAVLRGVIFAAFLLNALFFVVPVVQTGAEVTKEIHQTLDEIETEANGRTVIVRVNDFPSHVKLFEERGIDYEVSHQALDDPMIFYRNTKYQFAR